MKAINFAVASIAALTFGAVASAHQLPFKGKTIYTMTSGQNGAFTFDVNGRVRPLMKVTGGGRMAVDVVSGHIFGSATFVDHHGDKLFVTFEVTPDGQGGIDGTFEITGGTGHWIGHIGGGTVSGILGDATMVIIFDGVIDH